LISTACAPSRSSCASPAPASPNPASTTCTSPRKRRTTAAAETAPPRKARSVNHRGWIVQPLVICELTRNRPMSHPDIPAHRILILDFGSQYTQLIARRVRELGVYCELHPWDMSDEDIRAFAPRGIILAGGPESVHEEGSPRAPQAVFDLGVPLFGICYGMQT